MTFEIGSLGPIGPCPLVPAVLLSFVLYLALFSNKHRKAIWKLIVFQCVKILWQLPKASYFFH